ncbi:MAG TPA: PHP domain-containing protein [Clostridia bacterium]|nr:PHP domain-containing protein [Clostridia bacterium]
MKYAVDLHIHSALSPCADKDMTPNNIVNMAKIKGLDVIALTDHNSCANLKAVSKCAERSGLVFVPGMELETSEEVHLICLFPDVAAAVEMQCIVYSALPHMANRDDIFGRQLIMDETDRVIAEESRMLLSATALTSEEAYSVVRRLGGAVIPAHVDRPSNSILANLGFIPEGLGLKYLELSKYCDRVHFGVVHPELGGYGTVISSDAHDLGSILERETFLELSELSCDAVIGCLSDLYKFR